MAVEVDSIVVDLIVNADSYVANFDNASAAHGRFSKTLTALKTQTFDLQAEGAKYRQGADTIAQAEERTATRVTRARKAQGEAAKAAAKAAVDAEKDVERAIARREAAEARASAPKRPALRERYGPPTELQALRDEFKALDSFATDYEERLADIARRRERLTGVGAKTAQATAAPSRPVLGKAADVLASRKADAVRATNDAAAAEERVKQALAEQVVLRALIASTAGKEKQALQDMLADRRTENALLKQGLSEQQAAAELETIRARRTAHRAEQEAVASRGRRGGFGSANEFALQASGGRFGYSFSPGAVAGLAVGAGVFGGAEAVNYATSNARQLTATSEELGLTTKQLQVYQAAARQANVSNEQLQSGFGQLAANLGKAKEGGEQESKVFKALGIDIKGAASAGDLLPTLIDRISSIKDPAQRAALETRLFGEEGRKLDALLSGGNQAVSDLAENLEKTGAILSDGQIKDLNHLANDIAKLKAELAVDVSRIIDQNAGSIRGLVSAISQLVSLDGYLARFSDRLAGILEDSRDYFRAGVKAIGGNTQGARDALQEISDRSTDRKAASIKIGFLGGDPPVQPGKVDPKLLANLNTPKGRKGPDLARQAAERDKYIADTLAGFDNDILNARKETTSDELERAAISREELAGQTKKRADDIAANGKLKHLSDEQITTLQRRNREVDAAQADAINHGENARLLADALGLDEASLSNQRDLLTEQEGLAKSAAARRVIELRLLELAEEEERRRLQDAASDTALKYHSQEQVTEAQNRLAALPAIYANKRQAAVEGTRDKLETAFTPKTADQINESLRDVAADGVAKLNDGLAEAGARFLKLGGIAGQVANQIIADLLRIALQQAESGGGFAGLFGSVGKLFGLGGGLASAPLGVSSVGPLSFGAPPLLATSTPGLAGGGIFDVGDHGGVDNNVLSINGRPRVRVSGSERIAVLPRDIGPINPRVGATVIGGDTHYNVTVRAENSVTPAGFASGLAKQILQEADRMDANRQGSTLNATPARVKRVQTLGS